MHWRARATPEELMVYLAGLAPDNETAWDCATGSGQAAVGIAEHFEYVFATDASSTQIDNAQQHDRITYSVQQAEQTRFAQHQMSLVTVAQALHWFDLEGFFVELDRVLKPKGVFAVFGYSFFQFGDSLDAAIQQHILEPIARFWAPENKLLWDGYRDIPLPYEELNVPRFSIAMRWTLDDMLAYLNTWSAVQRCLEEADSKLLKSAREKLRPRWGVEAIREVHQPLVLRVSRKTS